MPYSGPASAYGVIGKADAAYFKMINDQGGINGRKINLHQPRRRLQPAQDGRADPQARRAGRGRLHVQQRSARRPTTAVQPYLNENKVPQLFVATGAAMWADPQHFPWTMGWQPNYQTEARIYGKSILADQAGRQDRRALPERRVRQGLSDRPEGRARRRQCAMIVKEASYEVSEPTVDSQIVSLQDSGADVLLIAATPKFAAQAIRKILRHRLDADCTT